MTLIELNPKWSVADVMKYFPSERHGMGVVFDCPIHRNHRLAVMFLNPIDGQPPAEGQNQLWKRTGDTFETLSLLPSIDASESPLGFGGCWHGFITNGQIT